ncbi:tetratricopeptide repeat protein [Candidatus Nitrospira bockiana]
MLRRHGYRVCVLLVLLSGCSGFPRPFTPTDPLSIEEHVRLGEIYAQQGLDEQAKRQFAQAIARDPSSVAAWVALGNLSFSRNHFEEAIVHYRQAWLQEPGNPATANNLAMAYAMAGERLDEAEGLARTALRVESPLRPYILDTLATIYLKRQRYGEAASLLDEAERITPAHDYRLKERLAQLRAQLAATPGH